MKKTHKSRYGDDRYFEKISNGYIVYGESPYMRTDIDTKFIDFSGGPFLAIDTNLKEFGLKGIIRKIECIEDETKPNCYKLITKL